MKEIEKETLRYLGDNPDSPDVFTDDSAGMVQIRDSLNDAIEEIALITGGVKRTYQLACRENQTYYRLKFTRDQFGWVVDAWLPEYKRRLEQTDIYRLNQFNPRWMQNTGTPQAYFPIGHNTIGLWPMPSGDNLQVELTCVVIPQRYLEEDDRIKIKESWQTIAPNFALAEFRAIQGDAKSATYDLQKYLELLGGITGFPMAEERIREFKTHKEPWPKPTGG